MPLSDTVGTLRAHRSSLRQRVLPLNYSRLYEFTPSDTEGGVTLETALPDTNNDDAHEVLFDSLRAVFHTHPRRQFGIFDSSLATPAFASAVSDYHSQNIDADDLGLKLAEQILLGVMQLETKSGEKLHPWYLWL